MKQDYNRYSYVRNNPLKYTDPSGYYVSGGYGYYDNTLSSYTKRLYEGREIWNRQLDEVYKRGDFGITNSPLDAFYAYFGISNNGDGGPNSYLPASLQFDMAMAAVVAQTGLPFEKKDGKWGIWVDSWRIAGIQYYFEDFNTLPTFERIKTFVSFSYNPENNTITIDDKAINSIISHYDNNIEFYSNVSFGINLETMMISGAAAYNTQKLILTIGKLATKSSAGAGFVFNAMDAWRAYNKGHYYEGSWQGIQALGYIVGGVFLFIPGTQVAGLWIIGVNSAADVGEYFYVNWQKN